MKLQMTLRLWSLVLAVALAAVTAPPALAAKKKTKEPWDHPMTFTHVRASGVCEPLCPEWIAADGVIAVDTSRRFRAFLKKNKVDGLPLIIQSAGGSDISTAMLFGRLLRAMNMTVAVGHTQYLVCDPYEKQCGPKPGINRGFVIDTMAYCFSSCPIVLAGGSKRFVDWDAWLGVTQSSTVWPRYKILYRDTYKIVNGKKKRISRKEIKRTALKPKVQVGIGSEFRKTFVAYFEEMGVSANLVDEFENGLPDELTYLGHFARMRLRLINLAGGAEQIADRWVCKKALPPPNCVLAKP